MGMEWLNPVTYGYDKWRKSYQDPTKDAMQSMDQIPGLLKDYYEPYAQMGQHPGQSYNQMGQDFQQSPGFQFALQQALGAGKNAAAAGGMLGSPMHQQDAMQTATNLGNQDYYNWMNGAQGQQQMGYGATNELAQSLSNTLMGKANLQYSGAAAKNQRRDAMIGQLLGAFSSLGGAAAGGGGGMR